MSEQGFLGRLRKGRVVQVLAVYLGVSWVAVQVVLALRELIGLPEWIGPVTLVLLLIGLIVVAATAWVQSHPQTDAKESAGEVPADWELGWRDLWRSLRSGRVPHLNWGRVVLGGVVALSLLVGVAGSYVLIQDGGRAFRPSPLEAAEAGIGVAVFPFEASGTGVDPLLAEGIMDLLATNIDAITGLRAISPRGVLSKGDDASMLEHARAARAAYLVSGRVTGVGERLRVQAEVRDTRNGRRIGEPAQADGAASDLLALVDSLSVKVASAMLEGSPEYAPGFRPSMSLTGSPAALRAYLEGEAHFRRLEFPEALTAYERAVHADSTFALAWARMAFTMGWVENIAADVRPALDRALRNAARLPERDRLVLEGQVALQTANLHALPDLQKATQRYPDDPALWNNLGEFYSHQGSQLLIGLRAEYETYLQAIRLQPDFYPYYIHAIELSILLEDTATSRALLAASADRLGTHHAQALRLAHDLAFGSAAEQQAAVAAIDTFQTTGTSVEASLSLPQLSQYRERHARLRRSAPSAPTRSLRILAVVLTTRGKMREAVSLLDDRHWPTGWRQMVGHLLYEQGAPPPSGGWETIFSLAHTDTTIVTLLTLSAAYAADRGDWAEHARALAHMRTQEQVRVEKNDTAALRAIRARIRVAEGHAAWRRGDLATARRLLEGTLADVGYTLNGATRWWLAEVLSALGDDAEARATTSHSAAGIRIATS